MTSRSTICVRSVAVGISACLSALCGIVWLASLFYYFSCGFYLPTQSGLNRLEAGYGMIYLTINDDALPRRRYFGGGAMQAMPDELRDDNIRRLLQFRLPIDWLNGHTTSFGYETGQDYRGHDQPYSSYWCAAPIPCMLFSIPVWAAWVYRRRLFRAKTH